MTASVALLLAVLPQAAQAQGPVIITEKAVPVGTVIEETQDTQMGMKMAINFGGQAQNKDITEKGSEKQLIEVLSTKGSSITKAKVTYKVLSKTKTEDGKSTQLPEPNVINQTFTVTWSKEGEEMKVTDAKGQEPPVQVLERVRKDFKSMGRPNDFLKVLPKGGVTKGQKINITKDLAAQIFGGDDQNQEQLDLQDSSLTFQGTKKVNGIEAATFDISLNIKGGQGPLQMTMDLKGQVVLAVDGGWPIEMNIQGPMNMSSGGGQGPSLDGKGKLNLKNVYKYKLP
jgi:hypothetical protein